MVSAIADLAIGALIGNVIAVIALVLIYARLERKGKQ